MQPMRGGRQQACGDSPHGHPMPGWWLGTALPRQVVLWNFGCAPERMALTFLVSSDSHQCAPAEQPEGSSPWPPEQHGADRQGGGCNHPS